MGAVMSSFVRQFCVVAVAFLFILPAAFAEQGDLVWLNQYQGHICADPTDPCARADLDRNGQIDLQDVAVFIEIVTALLDPIE